ncbi:MAG: NTP transferase domain-containing protein [Phaeodactylibacter sp.]|nr:NTP transferase domain-containing protein [Phaeodactylibacter sp.]
MKAMIFAAGLGTRLRPLTNDRPKALVEAGTMPLLEFAIRRLKFFGWQTIVVNVHHFAAQIEDFLEAHQNFGLDIRISDERGLLLETGGGLKKASRHFQDGSVLLYNADIVSNIDLKALWAYHHAGNHLATLAIRDRDSSRHLLFDANHVLKGWKNRKTGETKWCAAPLPNPKALAFSGIHVVHPDLFAFFPEQDRFSIIDVYLKAGKTGRIQGYRHDADIWVDAGKPSTLPLAAEWIPKIPIL